MESTNGGVGCGGGGCKAGPAVVWWPELVGVVREPMWVVGPRPWMELDIKRGFGLNHREWGV